ncbi:MAG: WbuC family cupin fold metalloprotein, partial [Polyangiaceae bacterium]
TVAPRRERVASSHVQRGAARQLHCPAPALGSAKGGVVVVLRGALAFFTFDEQGRVEECLEVRAGGPVFGVDLEPGVYHTFVALEPDTVVFEVKSGPYSPATDKAFPEWAPREHSQGSSKYLAWLKAVFAQRSSTKSA